MIRSVSRVIIARANASSVFQLFSFLVVCSGTISKGFGFVAFFASVEGSSVCTEAAEMKLLRPLAGYTLYDHKTNDYIRRELRITDTLDKIDELYLLVV